MVLTHFTFDDLLLTPLRPRFPVHRTVFSKYNKQTVHAVLHPLPCQYHMSYRKYHDHRVTNILPVNLITTTSGIASWLTRPTSEPA